MNTTIEKIDSLFDYKNTYIIGDAIANGCTVFNIKDIDDICNRFRVHDSIKQEVIDMRKTLALTKYKKYLDILVNDANTKVRVNVALSGIKEYLDIL